MAKLVALTIIVIAVASAFPIVMHLLILMTTSTGWYLASRGNLS